MDPLAPNLDTSSYTHHRLLHATPEHLYLTSRRAFIGPIPEGWLRSHRKSWYEHHLHLNYSSKSASFSATEGTGRQRRVTGLEDGARVGVSFPQPLEISDEEEEGPDEDDEGEIVRVEAPRAGNPDEEVVEAEVTRTGRSAGGSTEVIDAALPLDGAEDSPVDVETHKKHGQVVDSTNRQEGLLKPPAPSTRQRSPAGARVISGTSPKQSSSLRKGKDENDEQNMLRASSGSSRNDTTRGSSLGEIQSGADAASTSSLLQRDAKPEDEDVDAQNSSPGNAQRGILSKVKHTISRSGDEGDAALSARRRSRIHFDLPEDLSQAAVLTKARMTQMDLKRPLKSALRRRTGLDGQILKMEKMLVRVDTTREKKLPDDYDENSSQGVITQTLEKWREFMVVCRQGNEGDEADFVLQIYKTRVIPAIESTRGQKKVTREIQLDRKLTKVNLYSSLDKSVVIWRPTGQGTKILILRPSTTQSGVEWFTFIRNILGWHRATQLIVNVPDMSLSLRIENPFHSLEAKDDAVDDDEETAIEKAVAKERAVARDIIDRCLAMLKSSPEWAGVIERWSTTQRIGLAWKRYDRLEWIYGANERKMYGSIALMKYMELELRAKEHYPTQSKTRKGKAIVEPPGVEGFLIRLTSQKGVHQRMGKLFFKRLYFHSHNNFLVYSRPAAADPPPPPKMPSSARSNVPGVSEMSEQIPLIYAVNPFPFEDGQIAWLKDGHSGTSEERRLHDQDALDEYKRKVTNVTGCDGFIDLCDVRKVRDVKRDEEEDIESGSEVDFDADVEDTMEDDGETSEINDEKCFELALHSGLVIRLQAFDKETKKEWKKRLRALVKYWKYRHAADVDLLKSVRKQNLEELQIDEETEAMMGQFAKKWEVTKSFASPVVYNMCGISCCRTIHISGPLYFKPRLHKLFTAVQCVLVPGKVLMFETVARSRSGKAVPHINHEKVDVIDLAECYLYSGLLTENDLLYQNRTFDSNQPGHNALPRMWLEDQWTSRDEDVMCCFVLWRPLGKGWFKSQERGTRLKRVSKLGATGRSSVFRARSRAERDHWVLALAAEIERCKAGEEVRIVDVKN